jgi:triphosphoribosyl-dephospho-CoA synthase
MVVTRDSHIRAAAATLREACREWDGRIPASLPRGGAGWAASMACLLEAGAPKPGNVHPAAAFPDLTYDDLVAAAIALGPILQRAADASLGTVILAAVRQSRRVTRSNANLGMILALAPLAAVQADGWTWAPESDSLAPLNAAVIAVLDKLDAADAAAIWLAIGEARAGGMGTTRRHDLAGPPPRDFLAAMRLAADSDSISALWAIGYADVLGALVADLAVALAESRDWRQAIVDAFVRHLARGPDSLITRRHGVTVAADVSARAAVVVATDPADRSRAVADFDRSLRAPRRINPGTTADLVAAALYILLRSSLS